jgi:hypothetical protein
MAKLTLVSLMCRGKIVRAFIKLPYVNEKPVISQSKIDDLFWSNCGFIPGREAKLFQLEYNR